MSLAEERDKVRRLEREIVDAKRALRRARLAGVVPEQIEALRERLRSMKDSASMIEARMQREIRRRRRG